MSQVSLADSKGRLSELIEDAIAGETVRITRRGKPVAELRGLPAPRAPIDFAAIEAHRNAMAFDPLDSGEFVRRLRDGQRY